MAGDMCRPTSDQQRPDTCDAGAGSPHLPLRPHWRCPACDGYWPCASAQTALLAEFRGSRLSLIVYLAGRLHDAIDDFSANPAGQVPDLYGRFLGWASQPPPAAQADMNQR